MSVNGIIGRTHINMLIEREQFDNHPSLHHHEYFLVQTVHDPIGVKNIFFICHNLCSISTNLALSSHITEHTLRGWIGTGRVGLPAGYIGRCRTS